MWFSSRKHFEDEQSSLAETIIQIVKVIALIYFRVGSIFNADDEFQFDIKHSYDRSATSR